jgi:hypothetical protein
VTEPLVGEALAQLAGETARRLARAFPLVARALPAELASHRGSLGASELTISTQVWTGSGSLGRLQIASVSASDGAMSSLTVLAMPGPPGAACLFAADLVAFRGALSLAIVDVQSLDSAGPRGAPLALADVATLAGIRARAMAGAQARTWGDDHASPFSANVLFATPRPEGALGILEAYRGYLEVFACALVGLRAEADAEALARRRAGTRRYLDALAGAKRQSRALSRLFGEAWTDDYCDRLFFAESLPPDSP